MIICGPKLALFFSNSCICNRLNSVTTTRLRRKGDAKRERKKSRDLTNYGIVERCSIDRTSLIE